MTDDAATTDPVPAGLGLRLIPTLRCGRLGEDFYVYDSLATQGPIVCVPTQKVPEKAVELIRTIQRRNPEGRALSLEEIKGFFAEEGDRRSVDVLVRRGYLEPAAAGQPPEPGTAESAAAASPPARRAGEAPAGGSFAEVEARHYFREASFFNVPLTIESGDAQVGLVGVPRSTLMLGVGTEQGPDSLRTLSQTSSWFDIHRDGVYSETGLDGGMPGVLCRGVLIKDYGNLGAEARTVGQLFATVAAAVEHLEEQGVRPLFVGGDHAVTFPIVDAYIKRHPDLCLLHLDAHNDLFFSDRILYNHSAVASNLLFHSQLSRLYSFGLRTASDPRAAHVERVAQGAGDRVRLASITALERMLAEPGRLDEAFADLPAETPCYLTIDLDVLSPEAIGNQVSTPVAGGLTWWELYEFVSLLFERRRILACDVVEFNPGRLGADATADGVVSLLLTLIDRLAR